MWPQNQPPPSPSHFWPENQPPPHLSKHPTTARLKAASLRGCLGHQTTVRDVLPTTLYYCNYKDLTRPISNHTSIKVSVRYVGKMVIEGFADRYEEIRSFKDVRDVDRIRAAQNQRRNEGTLTFWMVPWVCFLLESRKQHKKVNKEFGWCFRV